MLNLSTTQVSETWVVLRIADWHAGAVLYLEGDGKAIGLLKVKSNLVIRNWLVSDSVLKNDGTKNSPF